MITCCIVLLGLGSFTPVGSASPKLEFSAPPAKVETYDFAEIVIRVTDPDVANPFTDASVEGQFAREGSEPVKVDGFCDSTDGTVFRIRFMPSRSGRHEYSVTYRQQGLERTQTGSFNAAASGRKGLLRLDPASRLHFIWEGTGEHYFWNGTTTYYLLGWDGETIRQSIDRLHGLKINRLRVLVYGRNEPRPWGQPVVPTENFKLHLNPWHAERPDDIENPGFDLRRFNVDHWRKYERLLRYARDKDVIISVIFFIGAQVLPTPFEADSEEERLYYRYAVARLAGFSNVTWDLGNEYNFHRKAPDWADRMGHMVKKWDPYDHLTSAHNVAHLTPKSTWLDMQLLQRWDSGQTGYMLGQRAAQEKTGYSIPQVNEEYGYEDLWEEYPGHRAAETRRKNAWEITMASCYQTTGESARRGTGVAPDTGGGWVNGRGDDTMTMLLGYGHMVDFFTAFDWWNCHPLSEAVEGAASCLGKPGQLYILYFREGGRANVQLTEHQYRGRWFNPRTGRWEGACQGSGPGWTTPRTPDNEDWVLWLERDDTLKDTTAPEVVSVLSAGKGERILVQFDERVESASATNPANYRIEPDVKVQTVSLEGRHGKMAVLTVQSLDEDRRYTLQVLGVRDLASNEMKAAKVVFEYIPPGRPLVEIRSNEGQGRTTANAGTLRNLAERVQLTAERPVWSTNTPPGGGSHSLDFGSKAGQYAVDLPDATREALEGFKSFTITAWLNCTSDEEGPGGNRIVHMADTQGSRAGIDLVITRDGRLKIGVNEWPDGTQAASAPGLIPLDRNAGKDNWRFIAVTYDSTAATEHVKLYVGTATAGVRMHKAFSYDRGPVGNGTGVLTVGHFNPTMRRNHSDRMFRGLIDEVRIFGNSLDGTGALSLEEIRTLQR
ncbi:MAG: DUF4038 domain-containing protein [Verrucomicrobiia bacterium]